MLADSRPVGDSADCNCHAADTSITSPSPEGLIPVATSSRYLLGGKDTDQLARWREPDPEADLGPLVSGSEAMMLISKRDVNGFVVKIYDHYKKV